MKIVFSLGFATAATVSLPAAAVSSAPVPEPAPPAEEAVAPAVGKAIS